MWNCQVSMEQKKQSLLGTSRSCSWRRHNFFRKEQFNTVYNLIQFTQVQITAFLLEWQGSSPRRIIVPSAGQIEEGPPSLSHPDPYTLSRGALCASWLLIPGSTGITSMPHLHFIPLKCPHPVNSARSPINSLICVASIWIVGKTLEAKFWRIDGWIC